MTAPTMYVIQKSRFVPALAVLILIGCQRNIAHSTSTAESTSDPTATVTDIHISRNVIHSDVKRFGINIAGESFYDSGQMLRNLVSSNPGFEGETWQSIIRCATASATRCTEANQWNQWPANFLKDATFEFISGPAVGITGVVTQQDPANPNLKDDGISLHFDRLHAAPVPGDFVVVRKTIPGKPEAGWWPSTWAGGTLAVETKDLFPNSAGKQAIRLTADIPGQSAGVTAYFDSLAGHSFVQLHGAYHVGFRAKGLTGNRQLNINVHRDTGGHTEPFLAKSVVLSNRWQDYTLDFTANEHDAIGTASLGFSVGGGSALLDDVSLTPARTASNATAFRDEVVETLRDLHPGVLRYQDGDHLGSSIENLIAPAVGRQRSGWSERNFEQANVPLGLPEFLALCHAVGAEPWFNMPSAITPDETKHLIEYLAGPSTTLYGAKRALSGQSQPWTEVFPVIHLELGNEEWNGPTFAGTAMPDPIIYGGRARLIFQAARSAPFYPASRFDLVIGTFADLPDWTSKELSHSGAYDSTAVAPYLFNHFNDDSSNEAIFGPMFAEPERLDSLSTGSMAEQANVAAHAAHPAKLAVYEVNLGTADGSASQASVNRAVPSIAGGLTVIDHMLLMLRDLGITTQSIWALPGFQNGFSNTTGKPASETVPLFGAVVDMGGITNRRRPLYLAEQLANESILANMLETKVTGANPTWNQKLSTNDQVQISQAHALQTFAFSQGASRSLIIINLSRTGTQPITISGESPTGPVKLSVLTSEHIDDTNETAAKVAIKETTLPSFTTQTPYQVPPFSMTVLTWTTH
jgi:alpha-L-arabinofuranosidase